LPTRGGFRRLVLNAERTGVVAMAVPPLRFNPSHHWIHQAHSGRRTQVLANGRYRRIFFRRTSEPCGNGPAGPIICCGTMPATRDLFGFLSAGESISRARLCRVPSPLPQALAMDHGVSDSRCLRRHRTLSRPSTTTVPLWAPSSATSATTNLFARYMSWAAGGARTIHRRSKVRCVP